jgi:hypothetical protein
MPSRSLVSCCLFLIVLTCGCAASNHITSTPRSTIEQRLLVRALERALVKLDLQAFTGKTVAVDFHGLTADKDFAKEYFTAWLQSQGVRIAARPEEAHLRLKAFASALGVDRAQSFFGAPAFTVPLVGFVIPEIPLFKDVRHSGYAEINVFATETQTGDFVNQSAPATGSSTHNDYTVLVVIHFTHTDLESSGLRWSDS